MIEIRIHGRGGQGNVVAAYLLASAAIEQGAFAQAFPAFGAERRGAPVAAFVRISSHPFCRRDQVSHPNYLIVQDHALLHVPGLMEGLRPGGCVLVNANVASDGLNYEFVGPVQTLPATSMALKYLGRPVPNTALLAAFLALTQILPVSALIKALSNRFEGNVLVANTAIVDAAAAQVENGSWQEVAHAASA